jgi:histidinol dehydrogenase
MIKIYDTDKIGELTEKLKTRAESEPDDIIPVINSVINDIKSNGDKALLEYSRKFDKVDSDEIYMSNAERKALIDKVPSDLRNVMERAAENILRFHEAQKQQSWMISRDGKVMGQRVLPLQRVGMYVPGGSAAYPSSVLMSAIPAKVAGVEELVMATPPKNDGINPAIICAADIAGVTNIIKVGGAQVIAAMAYGTESIKRVDKIVGPGNIYVATAKRLVYGTVDIDMIAGPSEVLIIADETANPIYIAADLMSQAEHDANAASILITTSAELAVKVQNELERQMVTLSRCDIIRQSIENNGAIVIVDDIASAVELSDLIAPEHLELAVANPFDVLGMAKNAGSIFMGEYSPEPLGDYYAGPNHVLPTNGTARFASALSVDSFMKKSSYLYYGRNSLEAIKDDVIKFAEAEGLDAHANSVKVRFK